MDYERLVQGLIEEHAASPVDILGSGNADGELRYLRLLKGSYVRTISDVDRFCRMFKSSGRLLEIGSYLGCVSFALKKLGYSVSALDIPEFYDSQSLRSTFDRHAVPYCGHNLKQPRLPYESTCFDMVIMCEVIEHLNFNPLPALMEINRILKSGGYLYIGTPNQSRLVNRLRALTGRSVHNPIDHYFAQLGHNGNMIVGLHWREYTLQEMIELLEKMGFEIVERYYYQQTTCASGATAMRRVALWLAGLYPALRTFQVIVATKKRACDRVFRFTGVNS